MNTQLAKRFDGTLEALSYGPLKDDDGLTPSITAVSLAVNVHGDDLTLSNSPSYSAATATVSYTFTTAEATTLTADLPNLAIRARWTITASGSSFERSQFFDVVAVKIRTGVTSDDLMRAWTYLAGVRPVRSGTAGSGSTTTMIRDTAKRHEPSGFWRGATVRMSGGAARNQTRTVTAFDGYASELTLHEALSSAPAVGDTYDIFESYAGAIDDAYRQLVTQLTDSLGPNVVTGRFVDGNDLRDAHLALALRNVAKQRVAGGDDKGRAAFDLYSADYALAFERARVKIDAALSTTGEYDPDTVGDVRTPLTVWGR